MKLGPGDPHVSPGDPLLPSDYHVESGDPPLLPGNTSTCSILCGGEARASKQWGRVELLAEPELVLRVSKLPWSSSEINRKAVFKNQFKADKLC